MNNKLHIVSFDIPYPANYGGVIDVFFKLKWLHALGVEIILHCFQYGNRTPNIELNQYCKQVFYYKRNTGLAGISLTLSYIVYSRKNKELLKNLLQDDAPILFDGIHTTYFAHHPLLQNRTKLLRAHNIEHLYYAHLASQEKNVFKKMYFLLESKLLKKYEERLTPFHHIFSIAKEETETLKSKHKNTSWVPAFHANNAVETKIGKGTFILYHGNLSIKENEDVALKLIAHIDSQFSLVIAGKNPSSKLLGLQRTNVQVIANPTDTELHTLLNNAHIHILPSFQTQGLKLKLLNAMFNGRFCVVNQAMLQGSAITQSVILFDDFLSLNDIVSKLMLQEFTIQHVNERLQALAHFNNQQNAQLLLHYIQQSKSV